VLENGLRVPLHSLLSKALDAVEEARTEVALSAFEARQERLPAPEIDGDQDFTNAIESFETRFRREQEERSDKVLPELLAFFADRLKVQLREQGAKADLVDAVFSLGGQDDLVLIVRRVEALGKFLDTEDGKNLLAGFKRASNILRDEEKKSGGRFDGAIDAGLLDEAEEKALASAVDTAIPAATGAVKAEDFEAAMSELARLRAPVDAFFEKVLVNAPDQAVRANRLRLLNKIREATLAVADFSKVGG